MSTLATLVVKIVGDAGDFRDQMNSAANDTQSFGERVQQAGQIAMGVATGALVVLGGAVAAIGKSALNIAGDYQSSMNVLQATTGASAAQIKQLGALAKELGADMTLPATSAADAGVAMTALAQAGLKVNEILGASKGVLQLSAAAQIDNARAAEITANALHSFNLEGSKATMVADLLVAGATSSGQSVDQMALAFQMGASVANQAGVSIQNYTTMLAEMAQAGIKGSDAGTSIKTMLLRLIAPTDTAAGLMKNLGVNIYDASGKMKPITDILSNMNTALFGTATVMATVGGRTAEQDARLKSLQATQEGLVKQYQNLSAGISGAAMAEDKRRAKLAELAWEINQSGIAIGKLNGIQGTSMQTTKTLTEAERNAAMMTIFGTDAIRAASIVVGQGTDAFNKMSASVNQQGKAADMAGARMKGFKGVLEGIKSQVETALLAFGEPMLAPLETMFRGVADILGSSAMMDSVSKVGESFGKVLAGGIGTVASTLQSLQPIIQNVAGNFELFLEVLSTTGDPLAALDEVGKTFPAWQAAIQGVTGSLRGFIALVNKVVAAIAPYVAQAMTWISQNVQVKDVLIAVAIAIASVVLPAILGLVAGIAPIVIAFAALVAIVTVVRRAWEENWGGIRDALTAAWTGTILPALKQLWAWLQVNVPAAITALAGFWTGTLQPAIAAVWAFIQTSVIPMLGQLWTWLATNVPAAITALAGFWTGTLQPALAQVWAFIQTSVIPMLGQLWTWLATNVPAAITALAGFWTGTLQPAIAAVWAFIQTSVIPMLGQLWTWLATNMTAALQTLAGFWTGTLQPALAQVWAFIQTSVIPLLGALAGVWLAVVQKASEALAGLWQNVLQPALAAVWSFIQTSVIPMLGALAGVWLTAVHKGSEALASLWQNVLQPALAAVWSFIQTSIIPIFTNLYNLFKTSLEPILTNFSTSTLPGITGGFDGIGRAVSGVINWLKNLADGIKNLKLPDWLTPGSPTPFEDALVGISGGADTAASALSSGLASALSGLGSTLGGVMPAVQSLADSLTTVLGGAMSGLGDTLSGGLTSAMSGIGNALGGVMPAVQSLADSLTTVLGGAMSGLGDTLSGGLAAALSGIGNMPAVQALADSLSTVLGGAMGAAVGVLQGVLSPALLGLWDLIQTIIIPAVQAFANIISVALVGAWTILTTFWTEVLSPVFLAIWGFISGSLMPMFQAVADLVSSVVVTSFSGWWLLITQQLLPVLQSVWSFIQTNLIPIFNAVVDSIRKSLGPAFEWARANILNPFIDALTFILGYIDEIRNKIRGLTNALANVHLPGAGGGENPAPEARAGGGPVQAGKPYLVGEVGPEVFVPGMSGAIVPTSSVTTKQNNFNLTIYSSAPVESITQDFAMLQAMAA